MRTASGRLREGWVLHRPLATKAIDDGLMKAAEKLIKRRVTSYTKSQDYEKRQADNRRGVINLRLYYRVRYRTGREKGSWPGGRSRISTVWGIKKPIREVHGRD